METLAHLDKEEKRVKGGILVTGTLCIFTILQFFLQGSLSVMAHEIKKDFNIDAAAISLLSSAFFYSYILLQIPVGLILDKFGMKNTSLIAMLLMGVSCVLFSFVETLESALLVRSFMGVGASFAFIAMLRSIKIYFPSGKFILVMSFVEFFGMVGVALCNIFFSYLTDVSSWRTSILTTAALCFLLAFFWRSLDLSADDVLHKKEEKQNSEDIVQGPILSPLNILKRVLSDKIVWMNGLYAGFLYSLITVFVALWGIPYAEKLYGLSTTEAAFLVSFVYFGLAFASLILSFVVKIFNLKFVVRFGSLISVLLTAWFIYFPPENLIFAYVLLFMAGATCAVYQLCFGLVSHNVSAETQSTAGGVVNMLCMSGAPILQPLVGFALTLTQGSFLDGYESYTVSQYKSAFMILIFCLGLGFVFSWFIFPSKRRVKP